MISPGERESPSAAAPTTNGDVASRDLLQTRPAPTAAPTGQALLTEFIRYGRERPFEEIVRRYAGMVFSVCLRVTKDKHEAEDATQAVFLTLAVQAKRGAEIKALGPWLQQVAKRLSLDVRRGKKRRRTREERHHDDQTRRRSSVDDDALASPDLDELKTILHEELQRLPAKYRLPLVLHYFGGMTREEMAAELNCKPSTLGVRIFRAREMLAGRLNGRGVHLSAGAMAVAIGYLVRRTVTDAMVAGTTHAAAALAGGASLGTVGDLMAAHAGSAAAAARVVSLTRRASHVIVVGKVRLTVSLTMLALTSLGAGARALAMLPRVGISDVRQMITGQVDRLVRPLVEPLTRPLRADAAPPAPPWTPTWVAPVPAGPGGPEPVVVPVAAVAAVPFVSIARPVVAPAVPPAQVQTPPMPPPVTTVASPATPAAPERPPAESPTVVAAAGDPSARHFNAAAVRATPSTGTPPHTATTDLGTVSLTAGPTASPADDLYVPTAAAASPAYALGSPTTPAGVQIVQVPAVGGTVTESDGVVRGYGRVDRTGTLSVSGKVVADGGGVDRTLDLTGFTAVRVALPTAGSGSAAPPATGWYAADHGRLSLPLVSAVTPAAPPANVGPVAARSPTLAVSAAPVAPAPPTAATVLTWGADPSAAVLTPVNSVRLTVDGGPTPTGLSLLAADRSDAPAVPAADGAPVGLWQIDAAAPLSAVDLIVRYDDHLVDALGGDGSAVHLWTTDSLTDPWRPVDDATFALDPTDHLVSGSAADVAYFAVTVPPAADVDAAQMVAHPAAMLSFRLAVAAPAVLPEPTAAAAIALAAAGLLGRRRLRPAEIRTRL